MEKVKVGDTVTLIDRPWEWDGWKQLGRNVCKAIASIAGQSMGVEKITTNGFGQISAVFKDFMWVIPLCLLRRVEPAKHRYTADQEREAREIVYRLMTSNDGLFRFNAIGHKTYCLHYLRSRDVYTMEEIYTAFCAPNDEFSADIGRMVAICKLLDEPLPTWIKEG